MNELLEGALDNQFFVLNPGTAFEVAFYAWNCNRFALSPSRRQEAYPEGRGSAQPTGGVKVQATFVQESGVITINPLGRWAEKQLIK
jgi:hypothetical protein